MSVIIKLKKNTVFKNFSYLTLGSFFSQGLSLATVIIITNNLLPDEYGTYSFLLNQGMLLLAIGDLGIRNIIIRKISRNTNESKDLIYNGFILRFLAAIILTLIYGIYNYYLGSLNIEQVFLIGLSAFALSLWTLIEYIFIGNQKMLPVTIIKILYSFFWFVLVFYLPSEMYEINLLFSLFIMTNGIKALLLFIILKKKKLLIGTIDNFFRSSRNLLRESWPYFSLMLIMVPVTHLSNIYLELNSTMEEIGFFNLGRKLMGPVDIILGYALIAVFPNISALWKNDRNKFYRLITDNFQFFFMLALLMTFLCSFFAREIVLILFSETYLNAVNVTQLQVWYTFLMGINRLISIILGAADQEKVIFKLGILNALISIPMLYYGSMYGAIGLSYAYVISFALFEIYLWYYFKKTFKLKISKDSAMWLTALILFLISYFIPQETLIIKRIGISATIIAGMGYYIYKNKTQDIKV